MTGPGLAKAPRVGHSMLQALRFVAANRDCTKYACAKHIGAPFRDPAHSPGAMYATIDRCIDLGWLDARRAPGRSYALRITPEGEAMLEERTESEV